MTFLFLYLLAGVFAGLCAGLLGLGGGIIVVPLLAFIFAQHTTIPTPIVMHMAIASSLAIMVLSAQASVRAHLRHEQIEWPVYWRLFPGIIIGTIAGVFSADALRSELLHILFAVFLLVIGLRMLVINISTQRNPRLPPTAIFGVISVCIGFLSGLLGVGGGVLIVPFLASYVTSMRHSIAISAVCSLTVAVVGSMTNAITGLNEANLPAWSSGYIYWPAVLAVAVTSMIVAPQAAKLTYQLPVKRLRQIFGGFLLVTGFVMFF